MQDGRVLVIVETERQYRDFLDALSPAGCMYHVFKSVAEIEHIEGLTGLPYIFLGCRLALWDMLRDYLRQHDCYELPALMFTWEFPQDSSVQGNEILPTWEPPIAPWTFPMRSPYDRFVECCDKRHYVSRKTEEYRVGLFFCPECSAAYQLTIERHRIVDAQPFARG